ncbi:MAG: carbohydrate binding domain-containing protein [Kiritimatiellia bacterium]
MKDKITQTCRYEIKKIILSVFITIFLSSVMADNLIVNGGFEEGTPASGSANILSGWFVVSNPWERIKYHGIDDQVSYEGHRSAFIRIPSGEENMSGWFAQRKRMPVYGGKNYRLTFKAKISVQEEGTFAHVRLTRFNTEREERSSGQKIIEITPSDDWKSYSIEYAMPVNDREYFMQVMLYFKGRGAVWFDNVVFEEIDFPEVVMEFYPVSANDNREKTLYPIKGEPTGLIFHPYVSMKHEDLFLTLITPKALELRVASASRATVKKTETFVKLEGDEHCNHYRIPLEPEVVMPMEKLSRTLFRGKGLLFDAGAELKESELVWRLENKKGEIASGVLKVKPLNSYIGALPKRFKLFSWYAPLLNIQENSVLKDYIQSLKRSGIAGGGINNHGGKIKNDLGFIPVQSFWQPVPGGCLTQMLENNYVAKMVANRLKSAQGLNQVIANWNFEPGLKEYYHLCPKCRTAFETSSGKSISTLADGHAVEKALPAEFLAFRSEQYRVLIKSFADACRDAGAKSALSCYNFNADATPQMLLHYQRRLGNLSEHLKNLDYYCPQIYHQPEIIWKHLAAMSEHHPKIIPVFTSSERGNQTDHGYSLLNPHALKSEVLAAAAQKYPAVTLFFGSYVYDGRHFLELRHALNGLAKVEPFLFDGQDVPEAAQVTASESEGHIKLVVRKLKNKYLLMLFNMDMRRENSLVLKLTPDLKAFELSNPITDNYFQLENGKHIFATGENIPINLDSGAVKYIILAEPGNRKPEAEIEI